MKKQWIRVLASWIALAMPLSATGALCEAQPVEAAVEAVVETPVPVTPEPVTPEPAALEVEPEPATEAPATETPATETPATEAPATEVPATEAPATEAPATETPATEAPATELPATESPAPETPVPDPSASASAEPSLSPSPDPSASASPAPSPSASAQVIVAFAPIGATEITLEEKPALEQFLSALPTALQATLQDGSAASVPVTWRCPDFDAQQESYVFTAALTDAAYALAEGAAMPSFRLVITAGQKVYGDFTFDVGGDGALTLVGYAGSDGVVAVPVEVDGAPVTAIARTAFAGNCALRELAVPAGVLAIEGGAFANCASLTKVELPDSLEQVSGSLFDGCGALEDVQLNIALESEMADARGYTRRVELPDGRVREVSVRIERPFTDFNVQSGGEWHVTGAIVIDADHAASISGGGALRIDPSASLVVNGALNCSGACANAGRVTACGGSISGVDGEVLREHSWVEGVCSVCGAAQEGGGEVPGAPVTLTVRYAADRLEKTYDGTNGLDLGAEDFRIEGVAEGDEVVIAAINADFSGVNAGSYLATLSFALGGADAEKYAALPMELGVVVHKRPVTVTPREGQGKTYGDPEPSIRATYTGVVSGEALAGQLSRESGEAVGSYRITVGTLESANPNYAITLESGTFAIAPKSIAGGSVTVARIPNQRYTSGALTPAVEVRDGARALTQGVDYALSYAANVEVGAAAVTITGMGNYSGSRTASFQIIRVSGGGGGGIVSASAFLGMGDEYVGAAVDGAFGAASSGSLVVDGSDLGLVLFGEDGEPLTFTARARVIADAQGGEHRYICFDVAEPETADGDYGEPRLRLNMDVIAALRAEGYTDVEMNVGSAQARIPMDTLYAEYVDERGAFAVGSYEIRLWPLDAGAEELAQSQALADVETFLEPYHFELVALPAANGAVPADTAAPTAQPQDGEAGEDVLSLLMGVELLFAPEQAPDYQNVPYVLVSADAAQPELASEQGAAFILEGDVVKSVTTPMYGGVYALAPAQQAEG